MTAVVGWTGVVLAFISSLTLAVLGWRAQRRPDGPVRRGQLRTAVIGMVVGAVVAFGALQFALLTDDFSVSYVAENSARATPLLFKVTRQDLSQVLYSLTNELPAIPAARCRVVWQGENSHGRNRYACRSD